MQNDKRLAQRIAGGDGGAFEEFVDAYGERIQRLVQRNVPDESDREDVIQEIFVDLYRNIGSFRGSSSLATWVYRVALNHCLKHRERSAPAITDPYDETLSAAENHEGNPVHRAAQRELADQIDGALGNLSEQHRDVVILHELHGLTYGECAAVLNVPVGTVKSRLSNAFRRLRGHLGGYVLGDGVVLCPDTITESM